MKTILWEKQHTFVARCSEIVYTTQGSSMLRDVACLTERDTNHQPVSHAIGREFVEDTHELKIRHEQRLLALYFSFPHDLSNAVSAEDVAVINWVYERHWADLGTEYAAEDIIRLWFDFLLTWVGVKRHGPTRFRTAYSSI